LTTGGHNELVMTMAPFVPMHFGALHAYETVLLAVLAFGPFIVFAVVVIVLRRRDMAADDADRPSRAGSTSPGDAEDQQP
jgi:hypothetical protein